MKTAKTNSNFVWTTLRTTLIGALCLGLWSAGAQSQNLNNKVLVIDEGVDLHHSELRNRSYVNLAELYGQKSVDDDGNGLVDDVSGWNILSDDHEYFPAWLRKTFVDNSKTITVLLSLYNRIEEGDREALEIVYGNEKVAQAMSAVLGWSHGTHVGGIIVRYGNANANVASANVFSKSEEEQGTGASNSTPAFDSPIKVQDSIRRIKRIIAKSRSRILQENSGGVAPKFQSIFDDSKGITDYINQTKAEELAEKRLMSKVTQSISPRVVNLSLGSSKITLKAALDAMWENELIKAGKPLTTPKTALQQQNYNRLLNGVFDSFRTAWNEYFAANPNTLFVIAAGNDGDNTEVPNAGNNSINEVLPANCSRDHRNVITVAATNREGVKADFSNFSNTLVNVGAWGTAVPSLAPNENQVKMSGTSMASPYVAGLASKIFSINRKLTAANVRLLIEATVKKVPSLQGKVTSNGMVDDEAALEAARRSVYLNLQDAIAETLNSRAALVQSRNVLGLGFFQGTHVASAQVHKTSRFVKKMMNSRGQWNVEQVKDLFKDISTQL
jgi:subtilisin family serine protease